MRMFEPSVASPATNGIQCRAGIMSTARPQKNTEGHGQETRPLAAALSAAGCSEHGQRKQPEIRVLLALAVLTAPIAPAAGGHRQRSSVTESPDHGKTRSHRGPSVLIGVDPCS